MSELLNKNLESLPEEALKGVNGGSVNIDHLNGVHGLPSVPGCDGARAHAYFQDCPDQSGANAKSGTFNQTRDQFLGDSH